MKIASSGSFGSFAWELSPELAECLSERAKLATEVGQKMLGDREVPDMQRFLVDELTKQVLGFLHLLTGVNLIGGPGGLVIYTQFERHMVGITQECRSMLVALKKLDSETD